MQKGKLLNYKIVLLRILITFFREIFATIFFMIIVLVKKY